MKVEPVRGPKFASVVRKYGSSPLPATPVLAGHDPADPLAILLTNYLLWESSLALAVEALERLSRLSQEVRAAIARHAASCFCQAPIRFSS